MVADQSPPSTGRVWADFILPEGYDGNPNMTDGASFSVKWDGFVDEESGIKSYKWAVGSFLDKTLSLGESFYTDIQLEGSSYSYVINDMSIHTDVTYFVCIRAMNDAGLSTTACSDGVLVKLGKLTAGAVYDGPFDEDIDFQLDDNALWLHWAGFKDPVYGLKSYAWCYGLLNTTQNDDFDCLTLPASVEPPLKTYAHNFTTCPYIMANVIVSKLKR